ncbi:MAG: hypothetical protein IR527_00250, partial [Bacteroides sp.]
MFLNIIYISLISVFSLGNNLNYDFKIDINYNNEIILFLNDNSFHNKKLIFNVNGFNYLFLFNENKSFFPKNFTGSLISIKNYEFNIHKIYYKLKINSINSYKFIHINNYMLIFIITVLIILLFIIRKSMIFILFILFIFYLLSNKNYSDIFTIFKRF